MWKYAFTKFLKNPFGTLRRALQKKVIGPLKYGRGRGYDAEAYWRDRFARYGLSLRGAGDEGLSEEQNRQEYRKVGELFLSLCRDEKIDLASADVAEIGVGTGFYTGILHGAGARKYTGYDITDVLFPQLRQSFGGYQFIQQDVTSVPLGKQYDLIVMMDVVEHIVEESRLAAAMQHVKEALKPGGVLILSGVLKESRRYLFYVHAWTAQDILKHFAGFRWKGPIPYRSNYALVIRKAES